MHFDRYFCPKMFNNRRFVALESAAAAAAAAAAADVGYL